MRISDWSSDVCSSDLDQEGGPVQRLRDGFSRLPALAGFAAQYAHDPEAALALAHEHAWLMASEIRACGLDLSFAPVVDLGRGNRAIGERAFAAEARKSTRLNSSH